ncbi:MAG: hypothetical protein ACFB4J_04605 [Elainellaceae cyanobacterium]
MKIIRFIILVFACGLMLFSSVAPASAISASAKSSPTTGEAQLDEVYEKAEDVVKSNPVPDKNEQNKVRGDELNVVQQDNKGEVNTPENSKRATSVETSIENVLEDVLP